jgi:short-subunit dehydrogenase
LITGGSSGIGEAFADVFASEGFDLVLSARREERLRAVASELERRYGSTVHVVPLDLASPGAPLALFEAVHALGLDIDALVNNAGYGVPGAFLASTWDRHWGNIGVMVHATTELTHRFLPGMLERRYGRVINVASLAALVPPPAGHTLYAASKAFIVKFSEALSHEVRPAGVHVTALCPGFTLSGFHDVTGTRAQVSRMPSWMWMTSPEVARLGFDACMAGTTVCVPGRVNRTIAFFARHLPERVLVTAGRRTAKLYRKP